MKRPKGIPKFNSVEEEAKFWDTHSIADYLTYMKPIKAVYKPSSKKEETVTIRVASTLKREVESIARDYDIPTSSLVRMWIVEKVKDLRVR